MSIDLCNIKYSYICIYSMYSYIHTYINIYNSNPAIWSFIWTMCVPEHIHPMLGAAWLFPGLVAVSPESDGHNRVRAPSAKRRHVQTRSQHSGRALVPELMWESKRGGGEGGQFSGTKWSGLRDNSSVLLVCVCVWCSTCGCGQKGSPSCCQPSHPLSAHVVGAAVQQTREHGVPLFLGYHQRPLDRCVGQSESVEVKLSRCTVPTYTHGCGVNMRQVKGAKPSRNWRWQQLIIHNVTPYFVI